MATSPSIALEGAQQIVDEIKSKILAIFDAVNSQRFDPADPIWTKNYSRDYQHVGPLTGAWSDNRTGEYITLHVYLAGIAAFVRKNPDFRMHVQSVHVQIDQVRGCANAFYETIMTDSGGSRRKYAHNSFWAQEDGEWKRLRTTAVGPSAADAP